MAGYCFLFLAQVAVAGNVILGKLLSQRLPVFSFISLRFLISTVLFGIAIVVTQQQFLDREHPTKLWRPSDIYFLIAQALAGGFLFNALFFEGVKYTSATSSGIIGSSFPAILVILAYVFLKERPGAQKITAVALACFGILILALKDSKEHGQPYALSLWGDLLVLSAMIPQAFYSILSRQMRGRVSILWAALFLNGLAFVLMAPWGLVAMDMNHWVQIREASTLGLILASAFLSFSFFSLWTMGMRKVPAASAAVFGGVLPLATAVFAYVFLGESLSVSAALGMACILASLYWGTTPHIRPSPKTDFVAPSPQDR